MSAAWGSPTVAQTWPQFEYVLLTGKEAQLAAQGHAENVRSLRFGSSGKPVVQLQEKLAELLPTAAVTKSGVYDRATLGQVVLVQNEKKLAPTGIVSMSLAKAIELNWT